MRKKKERFCQSTGKIVLDYARLQQMTEAYRTLGKRIVTTIGSWDMLHIGHARYLECAAQEGDILVVGADSDRVVKLYKGDHRPVIPEAERCEMLGYLQWINLITLIDDYDQETGWQYKLLDVVRPDVFVAVEDSYPETQLAAIRERCAKVVVLPRQAETSTSHVLEKAIKGHFEAFLKTLGRT